MPSNKEPVKTKSQFKVRLTKALQTKSQFKVRLTKALQTKSQFKNSLGDALVTAGARLTCWTSATTLRAGRRQGHRAAAEEPGLPHVQELKLNNCGMGIGGGKILAAALTECHKNSSALGGPPLRLKGFAGRNRRRTRARALAQASSSWGILEELHMPLTAVLCPSAHGQLEEVHMPLTAVLCPSAHGSLEERPHASNGRVLMGSLEEVTCPRSGINHPGVTALAAHAASNADLRVAQPQRQHLTKRGAIANGPGTEALKHLRNVQELNLSVWGDHRGGPHLGTGPRSEEQDHLEKLDLTGNALGVEGCEALRRPCRA
ncbi:unnamed protein product [Arctogadus glacialis]